MKNDYFEYHLNINMAANSVYDIIVTGDLIRCAWIKYITTGHIKKPKAPSFGMEITSLSIPTNHGSIVINLRNIEHYDGDDDVIVAVRYAGAHAALVFYETTNPMINDMTSALLSEATCGAISDNGLNDNEINNIHSSIATINTIRVNSGDIPVLLVATSSDHQYLTNAPIEHTNEHICRISLDTKINIISPLLFILRQLTQHDDLYFTLNR